MRKILYLIFGLYVAHSATSYGYVVYGPHAGYRTGKMGVKDNEDKYAGENIGLSVGWASRFKVFFGYDANYVSGNISNEATSESTRMNELEHGPYIGYFMLPIKTSLYAVYTPQIKIAVEDESYEGKGFRVGTITYLHRHLGINVEYRQNVYESTKEIAENKYRSESWMLGVSVPFRL